MESQPQNPEFRNNPENFYPWNHTLTIYMDLFIVGRILKLNVNLKFSLFIFFHSPIAGIFLPF